MTDLQEVVDKTVAKAGTSEADSGYPYGEMDARKWAAEFVRIHGGDEGLMLAWFASAIMTGYDRAVFNSLKS